MQHSHFDRTESEKVPSVLFGRLPEAALKSRMFAGRLILQLAAKRQAGHSQAHRRPSHRPTEGELAVRRDLAAAALIPSSPGRRHLAADRAELAELSPVATALDHIEQFLPVGESHAWMLSRNPDLNGARPIDLIEQGRTGEVAQHVEATLRR